LSEADKARLIEQELFRKELRDGLTDHKPSSALTIDNARWPITTAIIPPSVWLFGFSAQKVVSNPQDVAEVTALLPGGLTGTNPEARCVAAAALSMLASVPGASPELQATYKAIEERALTNQKAGHPNVRAAGAQTVGCLKSDATKAPAPPSQPPAAAPEVPVGKPPAPTAVLKPDDVVYLQTYRDDQLQDATRLKEELQRAGFPVLGIENVAATDPDTAFKFPQLRSVDVRFYYDADREAARSLTTIIDRVLPFKVSATVHDLRGRSSKPKAGTLEIWLPCADSQAACIKGGPPAGRG